MNFGSGITELCMKRDHEVGVRDNEAGIRITVKEEMREH